MQLTDKFQYDKGKKIKYQIKHEQIPIKIPTELSESIYYLLWYVPNIKSEQSEKNDLLLNPQYDEFIFIEIMNAMGLKDEDILFTEEIAYDLIKPFLKEISTDCPKIIMSIASGETKTMAVLRHIRNAIAHGNFNVVENILVGFDLKRSEEVTEYRGFFKLDPRKLLEALRKIQFDYDSIKFISKAFKNSGYHVEAYQEKYKKSHEFELFAKKKGKKYAVDIKNYKYKSTISGPYLKELISQYEGLIEGITPILVINTSYLDEASKDKLLSYDVIILDIKNIKKMISGRDMISEIERAQSISRNIN